MCRSLGVFSSNGKRNNQTKGVIQLGLCWDCTSGNKMFGGNIDARIHIFSDSSIQKGITTLRELFNLDCTGIVLEGTKCLVET